MSARLNGKTIVQRPGPLPGVAVYPHASIDRLVEGFTHVGTIYEQIAEPCWAETRARIERSGDIDSEVWQEVLDLELAMAALRRDHPQAAAVVALTLLGFDNREVRGLGNWVGLKIRARAFLSAYLSGEDPELAYQLAGRPKKKRPAAVSSAQ